jgi:hypothetical protein
MLYCDVLNYYKRAKMSEMNHKVRDITYLKIKWERIRNDLKLNTKKKILDYYKYMHFDMTDLDTMNKERLIKYYITHYYYKEP